MKGNLAMRRRLFVSVLALVTSVATLGLGAGPADAHRRPDRPPRVRPVVFVHGFVGSGGQFETQAMRFASNGYPIDAVAVEEYDSLFSTISMSGVWDELDAKIDALRAKYHADKVDLVGHSLGTTVSQGYLGSSTERAARVAHYANLDGAPAAAPPGGVPTVAVWGEGNAAGAITGATNVHLPDQSHVQVATSAETFAAMYELFNGRPPKTTEIVRQRRVSLAGRVQLFPSNAAPTGVALEVWRVDPRTGFRRGHRPVATPAVGADGSWGPIWGSSTATYEIAVSREANTHHFYFQPFLRSDHQIHLLSQDPGTGLDALREKSDTTASLTLVRYKELWGDQGDGSDVLTLDGTNVLTPAIAPRTKRLNGLFAFDHQLDGITDLTAPIPTMAGLPFLSGADVFLPATSPPSRSIRIVLRPRGGGAPNVINVPAWPSTTDHSSIQLRDFTTPARWHPHH
jgi:pimeloyl-ACP methyl ester carboxylesterase